MLVRWTQPAADDLLHICDYTAERFGAAQARRVADAIYETAASLQDMPNRGRKGRKPDTREMLISGFPFVIIYRVGQEAVEIARIDGACSKALKAGTYRFKDLRRLLGDKRHA